MKKGDCVGLNCALQMSATSHASLQYSHLLSLRPRLFLLFLLVGRKIRSVRSCGLWLYGWQIMIHRTVHRGFSVGPSSLCKWWEEINGAHRMSKKLPDSRGAIIQINQRWADKRLQISGLKIKELTFKQKRRGFFCAFYVRAWDI